MLYQAASDNSTAILLLPDANKTTLPSQQHHQENNQTATIDVQQVLLVSLLISLILISVVGNCLVCVAIFTDRRLRKLGNAFIVSLAIADLFVSCLVMTFALCNDLMNQWIFGDWFCDVWISFDIMCCTASILNLCAISLDRFVHIKDCLLYNQWMTRRIAISAVIAIWFISGLVSFVPITLGWHKPPSSPLPSIVTLDPDQGPPINSYSSSLARLTLETKQRIDYDDDGDDDNDERQLSAASSDGQPDDDAQQRQDNARKRTRRRENNKTIVEVDVLPQCMLTLTPTYAVISSTISFYIPCIIMLGLYTKLFACARKHVKNIQAISKAPAPLTVTMPPPASGQVNLNDQPESVQTKQQHRCSKKARQHRARFCGRAWLKFNKLTRRPLETTSGPTNEQTEPENAQATINDKFRLRSAANQLTKVGRSSARGDRPISGGGSSSSARSSSLLARQEQQQLEEENQLTQQLTLDQIESPAASNIISSGELFLQKQPQQQPSSIVAQTAALSGQPATARATFEGALERAESWRQSSTSQEQRLNKRVEVNRNTTSFNLANQQQRGQQLATHKAAVTLGIIMGTFLFCWVPFFCLNIIKAFCVDCIPSSLFRAFTWLGYANSALNPIIYGIHNSEFRNAFNRIFFKHLNIKNSRYYLNRRFSAYDMRSNNHHSGHQHQHQHNHLSTTTNNNNNNNNISQSRSQSNYNCRSFAISRQLSATANQEERQSQSLLLAARAQQAASSGKSDTVT